MIKNMRTSSLQLAILALACEQVVVGYADVLECFYGYRLSQWRNGHWYFDSHNQPDSYIQSARVSICKSFLRLQRRGLLRRVHGEGGVYHSVALSVG